MVKTDDIIVFLCFTYFFVWFNCYILWLFFSICYIYAVFNILYLYNIYCDKNVVFSCLIFSILIVYIFVTIDNIFSAHLTSYLPILMDVLPNQTVNFIGNHSQFEGNDSNIDSNIIFGTIQQSHVSVWNIWSWKFTENELNEISYMVVLFTTEIYQVDQTPLANTSQDSLETRDNAQR